MDPLLISNITSWATLMPLWLTVHHYRSTPGKYNTPLSVVYTVIALSLIVNSITRILDESYQLVVWGGVATKVAFSLSLILMLLRTHHNRKIKDD